MIQGDDPNWAYETCCGNCPQGGCYVDQMTGAASEGFGWQRG
jgi:hypothetical protein